MDRYGVGRGTIRDALHALEVDGLVKISHGKHTTVAEPSIATLIEKIDVATRVLLARSSASVQHLLEARIFVERHLAREAANNSSEAHVRELRRLVAEQRSLLEDMPAFMEADERFHSFIATMSFNPALVAAHRSITDWAKPFLPTDGAFPNEASSRLGGHESIVDAISRHDPTGAEIAMARDVSSANRCRISPCSKGHEPILTGRQSMTPSCGTHSHL